MSRARLTSTSRFALVTCARMHARSSLSYMREVHTCARVQAVSHRPTDRPEARRSGIAHSSDREATHPSTLLPFARCCFRFVRRPARPSLHRRPPRRRCCAPLVVMSSQAAKKKKQKSNVKKKNQDRTDAEKGRRRVNVGEEVAVIRLLRADSLSLAISSAPFCSGVTAPQSGMTC